MSWRVCRWVSGWTHTNIPTHVHSDFTSRHTHANALASDMLLRPASHPRTISSPYFTGSRSSGKTPSGLWELEPRGAELLLQDGRSSRDGGGHSVSELPSRTIPTCDSWGAVELEKDGATRAVRHVLKHTLSTVDATCCGFLVRVT